MPKRKYASKRRRRKRSRKYTRRRKRLVRSFVPSGVPTTRMAKIRFSNTARLTSQTGILVSKYYVANGAWNPSDATLGNPP